MRAILTQIWQHPWLTLLILNSAVFLVARLYVDRGADLVELRPVHPHEPVNYIIAGNLAQPGDTGQFIFDELEGGIMLCNYEMTGWDPTAMYDALLTNLAFGHGAKASKIRIVAISCGDMVTRHLETDGLDNLVEAVAINPAPDPQLLKTPVRWGLRVTAPLMKTLTVALGLVSFVPIIPALGSRYSLALLADQWWQLAYGTVPHCVRNTTGVILSDYDAFLDNAKVQDYFEEVPTAFVVAGHADTIGQADQFLSAYRNLVFQSPSS